MKSRATAAAPHDDDIRQRVREALHLNRAPGFHFPGYLLALDWPHVGADKIVETMRAGPHCVDREGHVHIAALGVLVDTALASAPRLVIERGARQATVHLNVQFTGAPARGELHMETKLEGFSASDAVRQSLARGDLYSDGKAIAYGTATFVVLPPPQGVRLAPLPWQEQRRPEARALPLEDMDASEREVYAACERALAASGSGDASFIERFWDALPVRTRDGARCRVKIAPQHGNRVRHVQGGILFGLAAATAHAAVPRHPMLSNVSTWFVSPGQGDVLKIRSKVIHAGRSFAVVNTEIRTGEGALVLQAMSNHAASR